MAGVTMGSPNDQMAKTEILLKQTIFQQQASEAAIRTAVETQRYTRYMYWSVVVLTVSSALTLLVAVATYFKDTPKQYPPVLAPKTTPQK